MTLRHETMLVPTRIYELVGPYDDSLRIGADFDFAIRLFDAGCTHYEVPRTLLNFRVTGISNADVEGTQQEDRRVIGKHLPFLSTDEIKLLADRMSHTGVQLLDLADRHPTQPTLGRAIRAYVADNAAAGLAGRGRPQWRSAGDTLRRRLHQARRQMSPQISVGQRDFRAGRTLRRCLESLLRQSFADIEILCVNDCSPDDSQAIVDGYRAHDTRVKSLLNERNLGPGGSRNRGVRSAREPYVLSVDPDDTVPPAALDALHAAAAAVDADIVRGAYRREQSHHGAAMGVPEIRWPLGEKRALAATRLADTPALLASPEGHWAGLYRTELARAHPYPQDLRIGEDAVFLSRVLPRAAVIGVIPEVVYHYLANDNSAMNSFSFGSYLETLELAQARRSPARGPGSTRDRPPVVRHIPRPDLAQAILRSLHPDA